MVIKNDLLATVGCSSTLYNVATVSNPTVVKVESICCTWFLMFLTVRGGLPRSTFIGISTGLFLCFLSKTIKRFSLYALPITAYGQFSLRHIASNLVKCSGASAST